MAGESRTTLSQQTLASEHMFIIDVSSHCGTSVQILCEVVIHGSRKGTACWTTSINFAVKLYIQRKVMFFVFKYKIKLSGTSQD